MGSGKSAYAESLLAELMADGDGSATYIATAEARDADMAARIERHQARRGGGWRTVETPLEIAVDVRRYGERGAPVLIECLSLWLANLLEAGRDPVAETADLLAALSAVPAPVVLVANEVGLGGVPGNALARTFAEAAGTMNQTVAAVCHHVVLVAAGLPLTLKNQPANATRTRRV
jgi:adenosylcobinamide kinase / adenosylcobinamide-phosphate guanylyltransferase